MICSDTWHKYHESYFEIRIRNGEWNLRQLWNITSVINAKYHATNHAIICLYYYPRKVCNFHMWVFQMKLEYHFSKPTKLQNFPYSSIKWFIYIKKTVNLQQLKGKQCFKLVMWEGYHLSVEGRQNGCIFCEKNNGQFIKRVSGWTS